MKSILTAMLLLAVIGTNAQELKTERVVIITLDGLRWQEVFMGATDSLMNDKDYVKDTLKLQKLFDAPTAEERREKLLPWFWSTLATSGQIYGNRNLGNKVNVKNNYWFSYPGYNEILTGYADPKVNSNSKIYNSNHTVLEFFNNMPSYNGSVAAFASWDVFPYIINDKRSGIPVNAGFRTAEGKELSWKEQFLNEIQHTVPSPWSSVRLDMFTHNYCLEYMKRKHPRIVYISYGETDDFAHDGAYDHYLKSAHQTDQWIKELWEYIQSDPFYSGKTTLLITTDHGRGTKPKDSWKSHGTQYEGSDEIWIAAIGPDTKAVGEVKMKGQWYQNQLAKTAAAFLGEDYSHPQGTGGVMSELMKK